MVLQVDGRAFGAMGIAWARAWSCVSWWVGRLGQGSLWVTQEGVWIQSWRKWGATDRLYAGGLDDLIYSFRKLTPSVLGTMGWKGMRLEINELFQKDPRQD